MCVFFEFFRICVENTRIMKGLHLPYFHPELSTIICIDVYFKSLLYFCN